MTTSECEAKKARLAQAEDAWHQLNMGMSVVRTRYGDKEVELKPGNLGDLARYIQSLRCEVDRCCGTNLARHGRRVIHVVPV